MIDRQVDRIQEVDGIRCRQRREGAHLAGDVTQVDQSVRLGGELFGGDQAGCSLSDAAVPLKAYGPQIGGHLLI